MNAGSTVPCVVPAPVPRTTPRLYLSGYTALNIPAPVGTGGDWHLDTALLHPASRFLYTATLVKPLPFGTPATSASGGSFRIPEESDAAPVGDLTVNFVRGSGGGKEEEGRTMVLRGQVGCYTSRDQPFLLLDGHIQGVVSNYVNGPFTLTAETKR